jgi:hypothetical protein
VDIAYIGHEPGALCTTPIDCPFTQNYDDCLRYFAKSYDYSVIPGTASVTSGRVSYIVPNGLLGNPMANECFSKTLAKGPTMLIYNDVSGASNSCRDQTNSVDKTITGTIASTKRLHQLALSTVSTAGAALTFHYTADTGW